MQPTGRHRTISSGPTLGLISYIAPSSKLIGGMSALVAGKNRLGRSIAHWWICSISGAALHRFYKKSGFFVSQRGWDML